MSIRRRSTVHDLASLRLHPDGSRVRQSSSKGDDTVHAGVEGAAKFLQQKNHRAAKHTINDARNNWMATDAGGSSIIKMNKKKARPRNRQGDDIYVSEHEIIDLEGGTSSTSHDVAPADDDCKAQEPSLRILKDPRAKRRRKFYKNEEYLEIHTYDQLTLSPPSSELLKSIHHFASVLYSEKGLLFNAPQVARREKWARKRAKQNVAAESIRTSTGSDTEEVSLDKDFEDPQVAESDEESDETEDVARASPENIPARDATGKSVKMMLQPNKLSNQVEQTRPRRDMYKRFDGSALMAIGMLLQEQITTLVTNRVPDGWEDEMVECQKIKTIPEAAVAEVEESN